MGVSALPWCNKLERPLELPWVFAIVNMLDKSQSPQQSLSSPYLDRRWLLIPTSLRLE
jgi:hypothetical protein